MSTGVFRRALQSHTCIKVAEERKYTYFISMSSLALERMEIREFNDNWVEFEGYETAEAARKYLELPKFREYQPKARALLRLIATGKPVTLDSAQLNLLIQQETLMAEAKTAPKSAAKPTAPATKAGFGGKVNKLVPGVPSTPAALGKAPTKATPAGKTFADKVTAPAAAKGKAAAPAPAPAAAKGKAAAPAPAAVKAPRAAKEDNGKYTVGGDDSGIKRGMSRDFIDVAKKLKTFTRDKLLEASKSVQEDDAKRSAYFYYFVGKGIITPAA